MNAVVAFEPSHLFLGVDATVVDDTLDGSVPTIYAFEVEKHFLEANGIERRWYQVRNRLRLRRSRVDRKSVV